MDRSMMPTLLIVEDHRDYRQAVKTFLEASKIRVRMIEASCGEEGIMLARQKKPQIVLMDFNLGGINGVEAAVRIKSMLPACSIIMLSMFDIKEVEALSGPNLVKAFISKTDLWDKLVPSIQKALIPLGGF